MVGELAQFGDLTMVSLIKIVGTDKSQVSRALKHLLATHVIQRESVRSALRLTARGQLIAQKLHAGAHEHCEALLRGFRGREPHDLMAGVSHLTELATRLLEEEQHLETEPPQRRRVVSRIGLAMMRGAMLPEMLPARLAALSTLLLRSSALAFKRLTGLSNAKSTLLAYIWEYAPLTSIRASELMARTRKRIQRDAAVLADLDFIHRHKPAFSGDWIYDRTIEGSDIYRKLAAEIARRERYLVHDFTAQELQRFVDLLHRVHENSRIIRP